MLFQYLLKRTKVFRGLYRTYLARQIAPYEPSTWWDDRFYVSGVSDRQTISAGKNPLSAAYHYASVELIVCRHLRNSDWDIRDRIVCDLGSGAGHWLEFYLSLGVRHCTGIDVSSNAVDFLRNQFKNHRGVSIKHGRLRDVLSELEATFDLINAIGVMFHLVDDEEWEETIHHVGKSLLPGGLFVAGGHFGLFDRVNVQFDQDGAVNKRLRSRRRWKRALAAEGFGRVKVYGNRAYLWINDSLPENNVLVARKT